MQKASAMKAYRPIRQFLGNMEKPDMDSIDGRSFHRPKTTSKNPVLQWNGSRMWLLALLYARVGTCVSMGMGDYGGWANCRSSLRVPEHQRLPIQLPLSAERYLQEYVERCKKTAMSGEGRWWDMMWQRFQNCLKASSTRWSGGGPNRDQGGHPLAALWFDWAAPSGLRMVMSWLIPWMAELLFGTLCLSGLWLTVPELRAPPLFFQYAFWILSDCDGLVLS